MATWTLGWWLVTSHVIHHLSQSDSGNTTLSLVVSLLAVTFGCAMTLRLFPRYAIPSASKPTPKESWFRRIKGWFGAIVWCGAGVIWNLSIFAVLIESADKGRNANFVILIPFSAVGLVLLLVLFTGIALVLDTVFRLPNTAANESVESETNGGAFHGNKENQRRRTFVERLPCSVPLAPFIVCKLVRILRREYVSGR